MNTLLIMIGLLTVLTTLATAVVTLVKTGHQTTAIAQIHVMVNSRLTAVIDWGENLARILEAHGIDAPAPPKELDR